MRKFVMWILASLILVLPLSGMAQAVYSNSLSIGTQSGSVSVRVETADGGKIAVGEKVAVIGTVRGYHGMDIAYQWQSSPDGRDWSDVPGATALTYEFEVTEENDGFYWQLLVLAA